MIWSYRFVSFLSAFLLFTLQLMSGKMLLPYVGGAATTWTTLMVVCTLLFLLASVVARRWPFLHRFILIAGALQILLAPLILSKIDSIGQPILDVVIHAAAIIALPFTALAAMSPMMQSHFVRTYPSQDPYSLYRYSNAGSLIGLLSYPLVVEPFIGLNVQRIVWATLYFVVCGIVISLYTRMQPENIHLTDSSFKRQFVLSVIYLASLPSLFTYALTTYMTQNLIPSPLIWIIPLGMYLASYLLGFQDCLPYRREIMIPVSLLSLLIFTMAMSDTHVPYYLMVILGSCALLTSGYVMHREIYLRRPEPQMLTGYYYALAVGGVIATCITGLIAPLLFADLWEMPAILAILTVTLSQLFIKSRYPTSPTLMVVSCAVVTLLVLTTTTDRKFTRHSDAVFHARNFYGVTEVKEQERNGEKILSLVSGKIEHGNQSMTGDKEKEPTTYYSRETGIGKMLTEWKHQRSTPLKLGVIGLGVGTLSVYCNDGDTVRYYEINPHVMTVSEQFFTYNESCRRKNGQVEIIPGDARRSLEHEIATIGSQKFDVLVIDAFSGDAIPTHLLTREAVQLYLEHLQNEGVLAFHITNGFVDLHPILESIATSLGLVTYADDYQGYDWLFMAREATIHPQDVLWTHPVPSPTSAWTDDKSSLMSVWK